MSGGQGDARKPQRSAELAAGQVEHRTGEDDSAAALDGLACRCRRSSRGCGGKVHLPRTLDDRGRLAPFPQGGKGGGMGGWPPTAALPRSAARRYEKAARGRPLLNVRVHT
ncbi:hypothetical protein CJU94_39630 (plasmid) [Paraburkholderia aromaticivorans]|uniref:Uncharacterized protein n=1 Tax=Paraburkholderia aromaticivorans TaxID=2026199 RepID=A0A248W0L2_9BURK|nr:hypothetical protein CJU94_39630 [Paraburkholderia aromaticivorans]